MKIFGHSWEEIQRMQQGERVSRPVPMESDEETGKKIQRDVEKFGISVHRSVAVHYGIKFPDGYKLVGDEWRKS